MEMSRKKASTASKILEKSSFKTINSKIRKFFCLSISSQNKDFDFAF